MSAPLSYHMLQWREDIPRGGSAREAAVLSAATTLLAMSRAAGPITFTAATGTVGITGSVTILVAGRQITGAPASPFNLTALPSPDFDIPPRRRMQYLLLLDRGLLPIVVPAVPTPLNESAQRWAPNGPEALIKAINSLGGTPAVPPPTSPSIGRAVVGVITAWNDTDLPVTLGAVSLEYIVGTPLPPPVGASSAIMQGGFPGDMLLPFSIPPGVPPTLIGR